MTSELTELEVNVLDFERHWWQVPGAKDQAVRDRFGMSITRYYQHLNLIINRPAALAHDPMLVKRLRRLRENRQASRSARSLWG